MSEPIDFATFLERQRARAEAQRAEAKRAAEQARAEYRAWERGKGQEAIGIAYPWENRPYELSISQYELDLAFKLAKGVFARAAKLLKVDVDRLDNATQGTRWERKHKAQSKELVTAKWEGRQLVIKVKKPPNGSQVSLGADEAGNLIVVIDPPPSKAMVECIKLAQEILDKNDDK